MVDSNRKKNRRLIIMVSGRGSNMSAIINTCASQKWPIEIVRVISDCNCPALQIAHSLNVPSFICDRKLFENRRNFESDLVKIVHKLAPTLIALAGFMRILSSDFCDVFNNRIINIHPSLLPDYKGLKTHERVLQDTKKRHGATVHSVNKILDGGSVLCQGIVPVHEEDNEYTLAKRVMEVETFIYPHSIAAILSGKVKILDGNWTEGSMDKDFPKFNFQRNYFHPSFKNK